MRQQRAICCSPGSTSLIRHPANSRCRRKGVIGPDILCWSSTFLHQGKLRDPGFVSWHQDFHLLGGSIPPTSSPPWVALSESTAENGAMARPSRDTQTLEQIAPSPTTFAADKSLDPRARREIAVDVR